MTALATWSGCIGAWLLVAGPIYQAVGELREEQLEQDAFAAAMATADLPPPVSPWWWLLPPVAYVLQRRRKRAGRDAMVRQLSPEQLQQLVRFMNKATGWLLVASGAFFIAMKETWELTEFYEWPAAIFVGITVVVGFACAANAALREKRSQDLVGLQRSPIP